MSRAARRLVIGVGNAWRRDDGAGPELARLVAAAGASDCEARVLDGDGSRLLTMWQGRDDVWLVDAVAAAAPAGTIVELDGREPLPAAFGRSTHAFGVADAIALARILDRLPRRLTVVGIVGRDFGDGRGLTPPVAQAVSRLAATLAGHERPVVSAGDALASGNSA